ncbi:MAG: DUF1492 domain-containing protein [Clostridiales bacterium]|jgi:hypothetical protein|nr:DUF1492 domain-containing protein [Clostridiales bacterium]
MSDYELSKYYLLSKEIDILENEIALELGRAEEYISNNEILSVLESYVNKLKTKKHEAYTAKLKIEEFMDSVDDPEIRVILRLRYVKMMTWEQIGEEIYMSSSGAFRKCKRFFAAQRAV